MDIQEDIKDAKRLYDNSAIVLRLVADLEKAIELLKHISKSDEYLGYTSASALLKEWGIE